MKTMRKIFAGALALGLLAFSGAAAQDAPAASGHQPLAPTDTKQFGDWMVRCYPVSSPSPCDMFELLANKANHQRILSISIAYIPSSDKHVIQIAVPLGVLIQKHLTMSTDVYTSPELHYRRCDRAGCYVEMLVQNDAITALNAANGSGKISIYAGNGRRFDIPFSVKGFSDAHGAMQDLARKKSGKPADTAPAAPAAPAPSSAGGTDTSGGGDTTPTPDANPTPSP
ncbi:MAG TPA: invasion associated locus B family protein [Rhizomicrobium sp.]|jgi:invasion protein IalB|nr:invasion associated locus B family protein [Rhizomicrobium sp.]